MKASSGLSLYVNVIAVVQCIDTIKQSWHIYKESSS